MRPKVVIAVVALLWPAIPAERVVAQQGTLSDEALAILSGEWSGTIQGQTVGQDILVRFERLSTGGIAGFLGPAAMGRAEIPMQNIVSDGTRLSFRIDSQFGEFVGTITDGRATGTWRQGQGQQVVLSRSERTPPETPSTDGGASARVFGLWEMRQAGEPSTAPALSYLRFEASESGEITGRAGPAANPLSTPLDEIVLTGSELTFVAPTQQGWFIGTLSEDTVAGTVFEGVIAPMTLEKAHRN